MRRPLEATIIIAIIAAVAALNACASGGGGGREARCAAVPGDTIYRPVGMVYRRCAVDREAKATSTPRSTFSPNSGTRQACYSAELEFVVDATGKPIMSTVRTLHSNDAAFATSVAQQVSGMTFEPAMKDGHPVNQITTLKSAANVATVLVPAGGVVRPPTQHQSPC